MRIFIEKQVNEGNLQYGMYQELIEEEELMKAALAKVFSKLSAANNAKQFVAGCANRSCLLPRGLNSNVCLIFNLAPLCLRNILMDHKQIWPDFRFRSFVYGFLFGVVVMLVAWYIV